MTLRVTGSVSTRLLLVVVAVVVHAAVEAVTRHHPLLLHQALEAVLCPALRITHHLHKAGNHAAHVPIVCFYSVKAAEGEGC